ncbi:hypothetical protein ARMSODRAFT_948067 [Armillaria solidipes]|uniref:Uncharacterized protein n=1 Tax=Armillaria solidipes TaxID=1076256 RepID=A0A2H3BZL0_9AGAR|nr:hypothetical protein ARMSODRAFT_948067 [Armillaria solidipes]
MRATAILLAFCAIAVSAFPVPVDSNARRMVEGLPLMKPRSLYSKYGLVKRPASSPGYTP